MKPEITNAKTQTHGFNCRGAAYLNKTVERREYVPVSRVIAELETWFESGGTADYVTLAGSGEPTLNTGFGRVIEFAQRKSKIPVALLTNGSLLSDATVRADAAKADLVKVSLSCWDQASLDHLNRPATGIVFENLLEGLRQFRCDFKGELWLEVFLVWGTNATPADVVRIAKLAKGIAPAKVQLNTSVRPPCEEYAYPVHRNRLSELAGFFDPPAEVIAEYGKESLVESSANESDILRLLERRPCTLEQICDTFGMHRNEASKYIGKLIRTGNIIRRQTDHVSHFLVNQLVSRENLRDPRHL